MRDSVSHLLVGCSTPVGVIEGIASSPAFAISTCLKCSTPVGVIEGIAGMPIDAPEVVK